MNIFTRLVSEAARLMSQQPDYESWAYEIHHSKKEKCSFRNTAEASRHHEAGRLHRALTLPQTVPAHIRERTKSASTPRPIPSNCATSPAAAKASPAAHSRQGSGLFRIRGFMSFAMCCSGRAAGEPRDCV